MKGNSRFCGRAWPGSMRICLAWAVTLMATSPISPRVSRISSPAKTRHGATSEWPASRHQTIRGSSRSGESFHVDQMGDPDRRGPASSLPGPGIPRLPGAAASSCGGSGPLSISVSNSSFLGPVDLELNPQYNALIGGRGTGKSTILEYLRWALCDQPPGFADEDTPNYQARRTRLIDSTLKPVNGTVQVAFEVNGVPHLVRRSSQDGPLMMKVGSDEIRACNEDEVRALLPIQAYSQKQSSDVSVRVDELGRFITTPIRAVLRAARLAGCRSRGARSSGIRDASAPTGTDTDTSETRARRTVSVGAGNNPASLAHWPV